VADAPVGVDLGELQVEAAHLVGIVGPALDRDPGEPHAAARAREQRVPLGALGRRGDGVRVVKLVRRDAGDPRGGGAADVMPRARGVVGVAQREAVLADAGVERAPGVEGDRGGAERAGAGRRREGPAEAGASPLEDRLALMHRGGEGDVARGVGADERGRDGAAVRAQPRRRDLGGRALRREVGHGAHGRRPQRGGGDGEGAAVRDRAGAVGDDGLAWGLGGQHAHRVARLGRRDGAVGHLAEDGLVAGLVIVSGGERLGGADLADAHRDGREREEQVGGGAAPEGQSLALAGGLRGRHAGHVAGDIGDAGHEQAAALGPRRADAQPL
jgi:hypothetical protein